MTVVDELITEYKARDNQSHVLEQLARRHEQLHQAILRTFGAAMALAGVDRLADTLKSGASAAMDAASSYASLQARLEALVGSADLARQKLAMAELVAAPSPFTTKQLADATVTLEAFGVRSERVLPTLGKLGAAMGATTFQLEMFTRAFGKLSQGQMIEADVLAAMGVTRTDFASKGIKFDGSGQLKSSAKDSMDALEAIINERFGNILEKMSNTPEAKRASLEDAGEKVMRTIGDGLLKATAGGMEAWTKVLQALTESGVILEVVNKNVDALMGILGGDKADRAAWIVASILGFFYDLPDVLGAASNNVQEFWAMLENRGERALMKLGAIIAEVMRSIQSILSVAEKVSGAFHDRGVTGALGAMWENRGFLRGAFNVEGAASWVDAVNPAYAPKYQSVDLSKTRGRFYQMLSGSMAKPAEGIPDTSGLDWFTRPQAGAGADDTLTRIERNTEMTAKNTEKMDLHKILFGGGSRAAAGVSMLDIYPRADRPMPSGYARGRIDLRTTKAATMLERGMVQFLRDNLPMILRSVGVPVGV